ncbi:permease [Alkaliphilus peptidifermentans]|uniref:Predicted permease n=1 Tax=Alkaliphilus peptidifermentans DSM 18978 TaxID=1120976 RepID=A0A1G5HEP0_9FIRM|nr:permease [Alkaliphilus peptidifermentans]SCY62322.1 Predicted permease [Alkaliphilus peptidifermentans DSM 18978]
MDIFTVSLWVLTFTALFLSLVKNKEKTVSSMKMARSMMGSMIGDIFGILLLIGLLLTFIPPENIKNILGQSNYIASTIVSAIVGSITLIPAFVAFPLVGSFVDVGASIVPSVAFLTTLTMVGVVTFPLEKREFGLKFALTRNSMSFAFAIIIALLMGVLI